jgi:hypothetical protein
MNTYTTTDLVSLRQRELRAQAAEHRRSIESQAVASEPTTTRVAIAFKLRQVIGTLPTLRMPSPVAGRPQSA